MVDRLAHSMVGPNLADGMVGPWYGWSTVWLGGPWYGWLMVWLAHGMVGHQLMGRTGTSASLSVKASRWPDPPSAGGPGPRQVFPSTGRPPDGQACRGAGLTTDQHFTVRLTTLRNAELLSV